MKSIIILIAAALLPAVAFADAPVKSPVAEKVTLTIADADTLAGGLAKLNGAPTAGDPKILIPYTFNGDFTRTALFRDVGNLQAAETAAHAALVSTVTAVNQKYHLSWLPQKPGEVPALDMTKTKSEDGIAGMKEINAAFSMTFDVELYKITEDNLNIPGNPYPPSLSYELSAILKK